ncbi:TetR/AcrR family transcriptional regulator [Streptomyces broussonetiae]|uniref:Helix-turn-helix domain-containing protein n=1 Tax=Streptomyces broussonetiae TaxID=2686304 RepID=A0ABV5EKG8_9ACTN
MDSDAISDELRDALAAMQQQVSSAHATWIAALARRHPQLAGELWELHDSYCTRHEQLEALLLLLDEDSLPALKLYQAFGALDSTLITPATDAEQYETEPSNLDPHQRAAQTKRTRTRRALLEAALSLIAEGVTTSLMEESAARAGIGVATAYKHFATKDDLIRAVYIELLAPALKPTNERS